MDFSVLNNNQKKAVFHLNGPVLVIAGPGSGKTKVIEYRVLHLIENGVKPEKILLLTFTKRAAKQMLDRISKHDKKCLKVEGGTFHSFAYKLIRKYGRSFGFNKITILDELDSEELIGKILKENSFKKEEIPERDTLKTIFSLAVNKSISLNEIVLKYFPHFLSFLDNIEKVWVLYEKRKKQNGYFDFDDLLLAARDILKSSIGKKIMSDYEFIMVDEYQDTNPLQGEITYLLGENIRNILVVGDDAQSIYAFRGASHKNIMEFPKLFSSAEIIKLEENYRSTQNILDLSNRLLLNMEEKFYKNLVSVKKVYGDKPLLLLFNNYRDESDWIVNKVIELAKNGIPIKDQAVIFRSNYVSIFLQTELSKMKIPFKVFGGLRFYEMSHIKDYLSFLKILANPEDEISWGRIFRIFSGIGKKTEDKFLSSMKGTKTLKEIIKIMDLDPFKKKNSEDIRKLKTLLENTTIFIERKDFLKILRLIYEFYIPYFKEKFDDWPSRIEDLEMLMEIAVNSNDLETFLAEVSIEIPENLDKSGDFLTLTTIHSAKGLEWRAVFILGLSDGVLPSKRAKDMEEIEEEKRLLYVAITRAKEKLFLVHNLEKTGNGYYFGKSLSRFLMSENIFNFLEKIDFTEDFLRSVYSGEKENEIYLE